MINIYRKILLLFFLFLVCNLKMYAQQLNCTGKMLNSRDGKIDAICFSRTPNPIDNKTKYSIQISGVEIYEVDFTYYKERDSILVDFYDKQNPISKRESVKLMSKDSHFLICDYKPNVLPIDTASRTFQILFGIDHPNQQFITLYQFHATGGIQTQFFLQGVPKNFYEDHYNAVLLKRAIDSLQAKHNSSVASLKKDMISYKDSVKNSIEAKENANKLKGTAQMANTALQEDFTKKMDNIFISYFKNIYSINNEAFDVNFTFNCNGYGNITVDTAQSVLFKSGPQRNWLRDSLIRRIKPEIEKEVYKTRTSANLNPKLKTEFSNWFKKRISAYNLEADSAVFVETQRQINDELSLYETRTVDMPTIYTYTFNYTSAVKNPTWKFVNENDGTDKFVDKSDKEESVEITENLKRIFRDKFGARGNGKYLLKICTLSLNKDAFEGQDIYLIEKK